MSKPQKIEYHQIEAGHEFHPVSYQLDASIVATYLRAVGETSSLYQNTKLVPPMAAAAHALATLSDGISLPPRTIHVSQELEFFDTVNVGDTIVCNAKVIRKQDRGKLHIMTIDLNVFNQKHKRVLAGRTSFVLPGSDNGR
ncbi:MaoC family dehydratase N-terminal domain-containing protein [Chloroflexota bacterium]